VEGLQLAWDLGYQRERVELDSRCVIHLISSNANPDHQHISVIDRLQALVRHDLEVVFSHVYREGNKCSDYHSNQGHSMPLGFHSVPASAPMLMYWILYDS
ncbi:unnamed protein product, partial [Linum tenue]